MDRLHCITVVGASTLAVKCTLKYTSKNVLSGLVCTLLVLEFCVNGPECVRACVFSTKMQPSPVRNCASVS